MTELIVSGSNYIFDVLKSIKPREVVKEVETVIEKEVSEMSMTRVPRFFVRVAGISGASAVMLGAYGAHGKKTARKQ